MALTLWADNAQRTASENPAGFLSTIFSVPEMGCIQVYREVMRERPIIFPEPINSQESTGKEYQEYQLARLEAEKKVREVQDEYLLKCTRKTMEETETSPWDTLSDDEKEARARRSVRFLALSIDPTLLMSTNIAATRGLGVDSQNNPEFAEFAANYDTCQVQADGFALPLARAKTPQKMSEVWLNAYQHLAECFNNITEILFPPGPPAQLTEPGIQPKGPGAEPTGP